VSEYNISLGNNDFETRKKAEADFITFWNEQAKKLVWFQTWEKTLAGQFPYPEAWAGEDTRVSGGWKVQGGRMVPKKGLVVSSGSFFH